MNTVHPVLSDIPRSLEIMYLANGTWSEDISLFYLLRGKLMLELHIIFGPVMEPLVTQNQVFLKATTINILGI